MSTVFRCKTCSRAFARTEELRPHLYWHGISDPDVTTHFTQEEQEDAPAVGRAADKKGVAPAVGPAAEKKGMFGWLRRK